MRLTFTKNTHTKKRIHKNKKHRQLQKKNIKNLQGGENKEHSEVNLDHQVGKLLSKHLSNQAVGFLF